MVLPLHRLQHKNHSLHRSSSFTGMATTALQAGYHYISSLCTTPPQCQQITWVTKNTVLLSKLRHTFSNILSAKPMHCQYNHWWLKLVTHHPYIQCTTMPRSHNGNKVLSYSYLNKHWWLKLVKYCITYWFLQRHTIPIWYIQCAAMPRNHNGDWKYWATAT